MRLTFRRIEIHNFLSFSDEVFEFDTARKQGLTLICGKNNDIPGSRNGAGKCLDETTTISVEIPDEIFKKFTDSINEKNNGDGK